MLSARVYLSSKNPIKLGEFAKHCPPRIAQIRRQTPILGVVAVFRSSLPPKCSQKSLKRAVREATTANARGKVFDGLGLFLLIDPPKSFGWRFICSDFRLSAQVEADEVKPPGGESEWLVAVSTDGAIRTAQAMICPPARDAVIGCP